MPDNSPCLRLCVDEWSAFRTARDSAGGFLLWAANSKTDETPVTVTGRSRDVIQRQARVFGPGYKEHQSG